MIAVDPRTIALGAAVVVLFAVGFAAGHKWQAGEVADAEKAQAKAEAERDGWEAAAGKWERATGLWQRTVKQNAAEAERQREAARKALAGIEREREVGEREAADWRRRFSNAQRNPDCAELMRATQCPAFTDY